MESRKYENKFKYKKRNEADLVEEIAKRNMKIRKMKFKLSLWLDNLQLYQKDYLIFILKRLYLEQDFKRKRKKNIKNVKCITAVINFPFVFPCQFFPPGPA